jgi:tetratricopeptide (TPR) repeat protein
MKRDLRRDVQNIQAQLMQGRFDAGIKLCREVLAYAPREPNTLYMLGVAAAQIGDAVTTREAFSQALTVTPDRIDLLLNFGNFLRETDARAEALPLHQRAVSLAPQMPEAWKALALTQLSLDLCDEALFSANKLISISPKDESAWELAAGAAQRLKRLDEAVSMIERAIRLIPGSAMLNYALGQLCREQGKFKEAAIAYQTAQTLGFDSADLYRNTAESLLESGRSHDAVAFARLGLDRHSTDLELHRVVTRLHVESNSPGDPVEDLIIAARKHRTNASLWETAIGFLKYLDRKDDQRALLREALSSGCPSTPGLQSLEAIGLADEGKYEDMVSSYEKLLSLYPSETGIKFDFAVQLLKADEPDRAEALLVDALKIDPQDQLALAFRCSALRMMNDPREAALVDYERMVFDVQVPVPSGYSSSASYFGEVAEVLETLHHTQAHPIDQSVRGGTQTNGFLFRIAEPLIKSLEQQIRIAVAQAISGFPNDPRHPFWGRNVLGTAASDVLFSGAWSVRLRAQGYHTNHVHPKGWISSALYIAVPDEVAGATDDAGYIQFGAPEDKLGLNLSAVRTVKPEAGKLVLFPSYMWHGTVPFESSQSRITVAFDIVPHT